VLTEHLFLICPKNKIMDEKPRDIVIISKKTPCTEVVYRNSPYDGVFNNSDKKGDIPYVVSRNEPVEEDLLEWLSTASGWCGGFLNVDGDPLVIDDYGKLIIDSQRKFNAQVKSRRVGISFYYSLRGLANSHLNSEYQAVFVSYNQDDANNKIYYAKMGYENLPSAWKKKLVVDNVQRLEFESFNGKYKSRTALISHPQREPRGKGTRRTDIYLDEFAHYMWADNIYVAILPMISFFGSLNAGSSPLGNKGKFYDIVTDSVKYNYEVQWIPFYKCPRLVTDIKEASMAAEMGMPSYDLVAIYGTPALMEIYLNMDEDYFEQEYNCKFLDDALFFFPPVLVNNCKFDYRQTDLTNEDSESLPYPIVQRHSYKKFNFYRNDLESLKQAIQSGVVSRNLYAGYDVGRKKDSAEMMILEETDKSGANLQTILFAETLHQTSFEQQISFIRNVMKKLPIIKLGIDATGIGMPLAEQLEREFGSRVASVGFTNVIKNEIFVNLKIRFETQGIAIPDWIDLIRQLHSIKRTITAFSNVRYDVDSSEARYHHADKVIALALASIVGTPAEKTQFNSNLLPQAVEIKRTVRVPNGGNFVNSPSIIQPGGRYAGSFFDVPKLNEFDPMFVPRSVSISDRGDEKGNESEIGLTFDTLFGSKVK